LKLVDHVQQMAEYNHLMNQKVYTACAALSAETLAQNRGAFFKSILGTLNHLVVGDTLWLKRFYAADLNLVSLESVNNLPQPQALDSMLFTNLSELKNRRELLDQALLAFGNEVSESALHGTITYRNTKGIASTKVFFSVVMHLFNHQTHHRGQITTLLSQLEIDVGVTDLVAIIKNT